MGNTVIVVQSLRLTGIMSICLLCIPLTAHQRLTKSQEKKISLNQQKIIFFKRVNSEENTSVSIDDVMRLLQLCGELDKFQSCGEIESNRRLEFGGEINELYQTMVSIYKPSLLDRIQVNDICEFRRLPLHKSGFCIIRKIY